MPYKVDINNLSRDDWERYAREFADYSIYQTWAYQHVRAEMDGQELSRVIIKDENDHMVTMGHVRIKRIKTLGLNIGYMQWGPLIRSAKIKLNCSMEALEKLQESYLGSKVNILRVVPNIYATEAVGSVIDMFQASGFEHVDRITPYHTMMFPLDISIQEMRSKLHKSWRKRLKQAEHSGLETRQSSDPECLKILDQLYISAQKRKKFKGLDMQVFIRTQQLLLPDQKMNAVLVYDKDEPLTVDVTSYLGDTAVGLFQANSEKGLQRRASYLAWWQALLAAQRAGMRRFDLGGIDPKNNPNVYEFKMRMGAKEAFHVGTFEACNSLRTKLIWRTSERIYNLITK